VFALTFAIAADNFTKIAIIKNINQYIYPNSMKCQRCKNQADINYLENHLCKSCFTKMLEKRIRKHLRITEAIHKENKLIVVGEMCQYWLERIFPGLPLKIYKQVDKGEYLDNDSLLAKAKKLKARIVIPWTMDHENHYFLQHFIEGKKQLYLGDNKQYIKMLLPITDQEAQILAKIKGIIYRPLKEDRYTKFFGQLETKYPSVRYAFAGSTEEMAKALKN
jgi:hypothetical protein